MGFFALIIMETGKQGRDREKKDVCSAARIGEEIKSLSVVVQIPFFLHLPTNLNSKGKLFFLTSYLK